MQFLKQFRVNNQIRIPTVQVIDNEGNSLGVMNTSEALALAQSKFLDLVEVNPATNPSTAKIMDFGKFLYKKSKADRKSRFKQKTGELKSIRFAYATGDHDLDVKAGKINTFLKRGCKVRIDMIVRGREKAHVDVIREKLNIFLSKISEAYNVEQAPKNNPKGIQMTISRK